MRTFELTVERKWGDSWPIVAEHSAPNVFLPVRMEARLQLDLDELNKASTPKEYGTVLGKALFCDEVRDAFVKALPEESGDRLRVLLYVEAEDLRTLRWERLCGPLATGWDFLALNQQVPYSLHLPSRIDRRFRAFGRRDLRALLLVASPPGLEKYGLQHFDVGAAVNRVRTALGEISCDVLASVEGATGPPTLDALCEQITTGRYTLLHIVCHGKFERKSGDTILYLFREENPRGPDDHVDPVSGKQLLERLNRLHGGKGLPHFAFLAGARALHRRQRVLWGS